MTDNLYRLAELTPHLSRPTSTTSPRATTRSTPTIGFSADRGYDLATGLGTPDVGELIDDLSTAPFGSPSFDDPDQSVGGQHGDGTGRGHRHLMVPGQ